MLVYFLHFLFLGSLLANIFLFIPYFQEQNQTVHLYVATVFIIWGLVCWANLFKTQFSDPGVLLPDIGRNESEDEKYLHFYEDSF